MQKAGVFIKDFGLTTFFAFPTLFTSRCFLAGLSRKLKEKFLCDLCDSSEAGGESIMTFLVIAET